MNNNELIQILEAVGATDRDGIDCEDVLGMNWFDARDKAIAALSVKPEPAIPAMELEVLCSVCGEPTMHVVYGEPSRSAWPTCYACSHKEPAKLPEVERDASIDFEINDWLKDNYKQNDRASADGVRAQFRKVFDAWDKATAAHAAELAEKDAVIESARAAQSEVKNENK